MSIFYSCFFCTFASKCQLFWFFMIGILVENGLRKRYVLIGIFCEAVQFKLICLVGRIIKKRLFLKEQCKLNFCILFYHLEKATKIVFLNLFSKIFVMVLVANMLIQYIKFLISTIVIIIVLFHNMS